MRKKKAHDAFPPSFISSPLFFPSPISLPPFIKSTPISYIYNTPNTYQALALAKEKNLNFFKSAAQVDWVTANLYKNSGRQPPLFRQLYEAESSTYTYILADPESKCVCLCHVYLFLLNQMDPLLSSFFVLVLFILHSQTLCSNLLVPIST